MKGWLLDTNILSELRRGNRINRGVLDWFSSIDERDIYISVLTAGEIRKGIDLVRNKDSVQAMALEKWLGVIYTTYQDRLLNISWEIADRWGKLQAIRPLPSIDALLAATAASHDLTIVTRNITDFEGLNLKLLNPFN